jgi:predicted oxidoreductase
MNMVRSLEDSLRRMGADYVDRLLIHEPLQLVGSNEAQTLFEQVEVALGHVYGGIALFGS